MLPNSVLFPAPKGWECPKCGRCFAPWMSECSHCGKGGQVTIKPCVEPTTTAKDVIIRGFSTKTATSKGIS